MKLVYLGILTTSIVISLGVLSLTPAYLELNPNKTVLLSFSIITESENFNNRIRIYYSLTPKGHSVVAEKIREMMEFIESLQSIVNPQPGMNYV